MGKVGRFLAELLSLLGRIASALEAIAANGGKEVPRGPAEDVAARTALAKHTAALDALAVRLQQLEARKEAVDPARLELLEAEVVGLRGSVRKAWGKLSKDPEYTPAAARREDDDAAHAEAPQFLGGGSVVS